jgi:hypothetical protein
MKRRIFALFAVALALGALPDAACAIDRGWNRYSCWEFNLVFEYPVFLNEIEVGCSRDSTPKQWESGPPEFTKQWTWKNGRHMVKFSRSNDSLSYGLMSVSVYDNPEGYDLWHCATELATFRIDEPTKGGHRIEYDSLSVGEAHALHVRSYNWGLDQEYKWANLYVFRSQDGRIFAIHINDVGMKSIITDEYGDYDSVVDKILRSFEWVE